MARPIWSGTISFGLVNVPVKAYSAVHDHAVHFHQLEKDTGAEDPLREGVGDVRGSRCPRTRSSRASRCRRGTTSSWTRRSSTTCARTRRRPSTSATSSSWRPSTRSTTTTRTGSARRTRPARRPTSCCRPRWRAQQRVGIGTVVMRNKQYLAAVRPLDGALAMSTMRFADEVVPASDDRRRAERPLEAGAQGAAPGQPDHRLADVRLGPRSGTTTPTPTSCAT